MLDGTAQRDERITRTSEMDTGLLVIQEGDRSPALVCIHPIGGSVFSFADLAIELDEEWPVVGIQAKVHDPEIIRVGSIEELAAIYGRWILDAVRNDIVLCGWSLGGTIALEIARWLGDHGKAPRETIVIASSLTPLPGVPDDRREQDKWVWEQFAGMSAGPDYAPLLDGSFWDLDHDARLASIHAAARERKSRFLPHCSTMDVLAWRFEFFRTQILARQGYRPAPFEGSLFVIRPEEEANGDIHDWRAVAGGDVETVVLPGGHVSILHPPYLSGLARVVEARLEKHEASGENN